MPSGQFIKKFYKSSAWWDFHLETPPSLISFAFGGSLRFLLMWYYHLAHTGQLLVVMLTVGRNDILVCSSAFNFYLFGTEYGFNESCVDSSWPISIFYTMFSSVMLLKTYDRHRPRRNHFKDRPRPSLFSFFKGNRGITPAHRPE